MRRFAHLRFLAVLALAVPGVVQAAPPTQTGLAPPQPLIRAFSDTERADLKRISDYLNTLKTIQGQFLQISTDGRTERGTLYLRKPGRMRFEYQKPNPNLIVADGTSVAVVNSALKTTDRYPLLNSPLRLLLSENIDLTKDARIAAVKREQGAVSVTARETSGPATGSITLTLADSGAGLELRQWEVLDAQGGRTTIVLDNVRQVAEIPARLFVIEDLSPFQNGRR